MNNPDIKTLSKISRNEELSTADVCELLRVQDNSKIEEIRDAADEMRQRIIGPAVTFVRNRNVNYTNACINHCLFCGFHCRYGAPDSYILSSDEILKKIAETPDITEVCIQGGLNPDVSLDYCMQLIKEIKKEHPAIHIHGFSPMEIAYYARKENITWAHVIEGMQESGLDSIPGTAAEILVKEVREKLCGEKLSAKEWVKIIMLAHRIGVRSTATIMFGHIETVQDIAHHFNVLRNIQLQTNGFTEFIPLPFVPYKTALGKQYKIDEMVSTEKILLLYAVARLFFQDIIPNLQVSWVKIGIKAAVKSLKYGVNDLGGTLYEENITRCAGGRHGQVLDVENVKSLLKDRELIERTTMYQYRDKVVLPSIS